MNPRSHCPHPPHSCALAGQLSDYLDGALPQDRCAALENHLAGCQDCRELLATLGWTVRILHAVDAAPPPLPASVEARLLEQIARHLRLSTLC